MNGAEFVLDQTTILMIICFGSLFAWIFTRIKLFMLPLMAVLIFVFYELGGIVLALAMLAVGAFFWKLNK